MLSALSFAALVAYIENNMDPDKTAPSLRSSLISVHNASAHDKICLKCILIYAADIIIRRYFNNKKNYWQYQVLMWGL